MAMAVNDSVVIGGAGAATTRVVVRDDDGVRESEDGCPEDLPGVDQQAVDCTPSHLLSGPQAVPRIKAEAVEDLPVQVLEVAEKLVQFLPSYPGNPP